MTGIYMFSISLYRYMRKNLAFGWSSRWSPSIYANILLFANFYLRNAGINCNI